MGWHMYKLIVGIAFGVLMFGSNAMATCSSYPYTLTNGTTADASQVMANFNCAALTSGSNLTGSTLSGVTLSGTTLLPASGVITSSGYFGVGLNAKASGQSLDQALSVYGNIYFTNSFANASTKAWNILGAPFYSVYPGGDHDISYLNGTTGGSSYPSLELGGGISGNSAVNAIYFYTGSSYNTDTGTLRMVINGSGNVGIGTSSPSYTLHVNGSVAGTSAYNNLSDARLKKDVVPLVGGLALVNQLQPVRFDWRSKDEREVGKDFNLPSGKQIGFIAQDLRKVLPEAVSTAKGNDAIMSVAESKVVPVLVAAVKELKAANDNQAMEIGRLEAKVTVLERQTRIRTAQR
jgi:hypothetical protein